MENLQKSFSGGRLLSERAVSGLRLTDGIYLANTKVPKHSHDYAVFCIALKGACREFFAGRVRHYEALSVQYLPTYQCHTLDFSLTDTRAFSIDVNKKWLERAGGLFSQNRELNSLPWRFAVGADDEALP